jgi:hypothetical protein
MQIRSMVMCCLLGVGSLVAVAQAGDAASGPAAGTIATPADALDSQLSLIESEMMSAVKAMPADKFDFAPSQAIFVPGQKTEFATVRTFAQQATHVAQANYFYGTWLGLKTGVDWRAFSALTKKDDVVAALAGSFVFAHKAIATLTPANVFEEIKTPEPFPATRGTLASFGVSHAFDHYGQMVEYLRMNGIVPPASAK